MDAFALTPAERALFRALNERGVRRFESAGDERMRDAARQAGGFWVPSFGLPPPGIGGDGLDRVDTVLTASDGPRATPPSPVVPGTFRLSISGGVTQYDIATSGRLLVPQLDERDRREANRIHVLLNLTTELKARLP